MKNAQEEQILVTIRTLAIVRKAVAKTLAALDGPEA